MMKMTLDERHRKALKSIMLYGSAGFKLYENEKPDYILKQCYIPLLPW